MTTRSVRWFGGILIALASGACTSGSSPMPSAAIGIHSGAAFMHGENGCFLTYAPTFSTASLASEAYAAEGPRARLVPVILFHGDNDHVVPYQCGQQALAGDARLYQECCTVDACA